MLGFYGAMGLREIGRSLNRGVEQDRLDGLHGVAVDIVALAPLGGGPHLELLHYRSARCFVRQTDRWHRRNPDGRHDRRPAIDLARPRRTYPRLARLSGEISKGTRMAKYRVGIIGFGKIAHDQHVPAIAAVPAFELLAVSSTSGKTHPDATYFYTDYKEMLDKTPNLDAVAICTPPGPRRTIAADCLAAGKHVLLEKPLQGP